MKRDSDTIDPAKIQIQGDLDAALQNPAFQDALADLLIHRAALRRRQ
jgi:hypothetical protein